LLEGGNVYIGEWNPEDNTKCGRGKIIYKDGSLFEGMFARDKPNGQGRLIKDDGETYIGEWKDGMYNGEGTLIGINGSKYEGKFLNDRFHGWGRETWKDGS
jgi:hypothetical protein